VIIATSRLDLHPLPRPLIDALLAGDLVAAGALAPFAVGPESFAGDEYVLRLRQAQLRADPAEGPVEIGYRVLPQWQGQGLATELAAGLIAWAREHGAARCLASTRPGNAASRAVVAKLGFVLTGEQMDEVDGLELVHTLELDREEEGRA
jgi:RimJ/RimL family protein N-acetyltransferase